MHRTPNKPRAMGISTMWLVALLMTAGCALLPGLQTTVPPLTIPTATATMAITETPTAFTGECAFVWSNRTLPTTSLTINSALQAAGLNEVEAEASAYGENCVDTATNTVVRFTALQTDVYVQVQVADTSDGQALGEWVERVLRVINELPEGTLQGNNPGYLGITFISAQNSTNLWFPRSKADGLLNEGIRGSALYEALRDY